MTAFIERWSITGYTAALVALSVVLALRPLG